MAEAISLRRVQIGLEAVKGTAVQANKRVRSLGIVPQVNEAHDLIQDRGSRAAGAKVAQKAQHTVAPVNGAMTYHELAVILMTMATPVIVAVPTAPTAKDWIFRLPVLSVPDHKTLTVEVGDDNFVSRFAYATLQSGTMTFAPAGDTFEGQLIGRRMDKDGDPPITANPVDLPIIPLDPNTNSIFVADVAADLTDGTKRVARNTTATFTLGNLKNPLFTNDASVSSFSALVTPRTLGMMGQLAVLDDAFARALLTDARNHKAKYARIFNAGPQIEAGFFYEFDIRWPCFVQVPSDSEEEDRILATFDLPVRTDSAFEPTSDGTAATGGFVEFRLRLPVATIAALMGAPTDLPEDDQPDNGIDQMAADRIDSSHDGVIDPP